MITGAFGVFITTMIYLFLGLAVIASLLFIPFVIWLSKPQKKRFLSF